MPAVEVMARQPEKGDHAFSVDEAGGMVDLGNLGGTDSAVLGLNNAGQVVGWSFYRG